MVNFFSHHKDINTGNLDFVDKFEGDYYEMGANLAVFGSKKLYNEYRFFRRISTDEAVQKLKYFNKNLVLYSFARMFKLVRREAGLNKDKFSEPELLSFVINDITKPELMKDYFISRYNRTMIKFTLFASSIKYNQLFNRVYYLFLKPIVSIVYLSISLIIYKIVVKLPKFIWSKIAKNDKPLEDTKCL